jgi:hypothetical protein
MSAKSPKQIPADEIIWARSLDAKGNIRYVITSKALRDKYFLYYPDGNGYTRLGGGAKTPPELVRKFADFLSTVKS